jgi:hypothetical protein
MRCRFILCVYLFRICPAGTEIRQFSIANCIIVSILHDSATRDPDCGITLANHGYTETAHWRLPPQEQEAELEGCERSVRAAGLPSLLPLYRPGHGFFTERLETLCIQKGYRLLLGDVYPHDPQITWYAFFHQHSIFRLFR